MILNSNKAVTLVEVLFVAVIASMLLASGMLLWSRTSNSAARSSEMLNLQICARTLNSRLRDDIRTLTNMKVCSDHEIVFTALRGGETVEISYHYDQSKNSLLRKEAGKSDSLNSNGMISSLKFIALPSLQDFSSLQVLVELSNPTKLENQPYKTAQIFEFSSRSIDPVFVQVE